MKLHVHDLGLTPYSDALERQLALRAELQASEDPGFAGHLLILEHPPVITLGKRGRESDLLVDRDWLAGRGIEVHSIDRGGEATAHEPGQLVVYPIVRLDVLGIGVVDLVRGLAATLAETIGTFGVDAEYDTDHPGLWTREETPRKIASVGMRVSGGVTTHGAALNVTNDLSTFRLIVPCGMPQTPLARVAEFTADVRVDTVVERFVPRFRAFLNGDD